jgi:hypothetical protein
VTKQTFELYGCEITGIDRDRIAKELGWDTNTFKSLKIGQAEAALHFSISGLNGSGRPESWIVRFLWPDGTPNKFNFLLPALRFRFRVRHGKRGRKPGNPSS